MHSTVNTEWFPPKKLRLKMGKTSAEQRTYVGTYDKQILSRYMLDFVIYLMQIVSISLASVTFWT